MAHNPLNPRPRRELSPLQEEIVYWRFVNSTRPLSECARALKCSYSAVYNTKDNPKCKELYDELVERSNTAKVMQVQERKEVLSEIGRADVTQFVAPDGRIELTAENPNKRAVAEYEVNSIGHDEREVETRRKIKLISKIDAIQELNKMDNLYSTSPQVAINAPTFNIAVIDSEAEGLLKKLLSGQRGVIEAKQE